MKLIVINIFFLMTNTLFANEIRVYKSDRRLELLDDNQKLIKEYKVVLGQNPIGAKAFEGDNKTPEGDYLLDLANPNSKYHYAFHISYPTKSQILKARLHGKSPGGDIMLHGYPEQLSEINEWLSKMNLQNESESIVRELLPMKDWTNGCIALRNDEIDELAKFVKLPMKISIKP